MSRLGINIDHVATLRNARGEDHPNILEIAKIVKSSGANSITIHLREDRRHINDLDAKKICSIKNVLVNLEISTNSEIIKKAIKGMLPNSPLFRDLIKNNIKLYRDANHPHESQNPKNLDFKSINRKNKVNV